MTAGQQFTERSERQRMDDYERRKADWVRSHPEATPQEYQAAMTRIARECGV